MIDGATMGGKIKSVIEKVARGKLGVTAVAGAAPSNYVTAITSAKEKLPVASRCVAGGGRINVAGVTGRGAYHWEGVGRCVW